MNKPEWTPEHGALLESLRIKAGMDLATLARRNMLSTLQVKQLEKVVTLVSTVLQLSFQRVRSS